MLFTTLRHLFICDSTVSNRCTFSMIPYSFGNLLKRCNENAKTGRFCGRIVA